MKYVLAGTAAAAMFFGGAAGVSADYEDVGDDHWANEEIDFLTGQGIIEGHTDGTFRPNEPVTRAQTADMLVSTFGPQTDNRPDPGFGDVEEGDYAYYEILTAADEGWMSGTGSNFEPNNPLERGQMAAVIDRGFGLMPASFDGSFSDVDGNMFESSIYKIAGHGITRGYPDGTFRPGAETTRAEFSTFLARAIHPERFTGEEVENEEELIAVTDEFMAALRDGDMEEAASFVDEELLFSPYANVSDEDMSFTSEEVAGLWADDTVYDWGDFDGTGDDILKTYQEYDERFVYARDYLEEAEVNVNARLGMGNVIDNTDDVYPGSHVVEYHIPAEDEEGFEWQSLRLVVTEIDDEWYVEAVINDEWTI
ncbi:S-layer homology domain-containing protein [Alkalicoccus chagannorensis]|uniref:S-layer homology domain-containing protein n=1 Tax=Alkalicoccus chagannorensis TaxID=427072 RepID=UPI0003F5492C|nr:S-layer homology domain-containing protein [Alkalicoccus chagannorensis]